MVALRKVVRWLTGARVAVAPLRPVFRAVLALHVAAAHRGTGR